MRSLTWFVKGAARSFVVLIPALGAGAQRLELSRYAMPAAE
jgi:hypothetical protein